MKRLRKNCRGFTLVEIIVTFALTALFMSSAALVLSSFMHSHVVADAVAREQNVASIVMNTVTSELSAAKYEGSNCFKEDKMPPSAKADFPYADLDAAQLGKCQILIAEDGENSVVWYVNRDSGNRVKLCLDADGYLQWTYYLSADEKGENPDPPVATWGLGAKVYGDCWITGFHVEKIKAAKSSDSEGEESGGSADISLAAEGDNLGGGISLAAEGDDPGDGGAGGESGGGGSTGGESGDGGTGGSGGGGTEGILGGGSTEGSGGSGAGGTHGVSSGSAGVAADGTTNCLTVTLVMQNSRSEDNSYTMKRSFECYNLSAENILKIPPSE